MFSWPVKQAAWQSLSPHLLLTVLCSFQSQAGEGHNPPFQVGLQEVKLETELGTSDVLLCLYLRTHQWDKRESIYYEANSSSFLPNCSPHHPCGCRGLGPAERCRGGGSGLLLGSGPAQSLLAQAPCPRWPSCLGCAGTLSSAALQGEQLHLKPSHQPTEEVPEPALCLSPQCCSS